METLGNNHIFDFLINHKTDFYHTQSFSKKIYMIIQYLTECPPCKRTENNCLVYAATKCRIKCPFHFSFSNLQYSILKFFERGLVFIQPMFTLGIRSSKTHFFVFE